MPSIRGLTSPHLVILAALVLFVLVFAAREMRDDTGDAVAVLYVFPVTLLALQFGLTGGLAAALLAAVLTFVGGRDGLEISAVGYATRLSVLFGVGAMVGWVTDRARSLERQRKDGQRKLARFFDLSQDMLSTLGPDGHFDDLNPAWEATLGYTQHEIRSKPFIELVHPDDRARTETEAAGLASGDTTVSFENRFLAKDGSTRWLNWSSRLDSADGLIYGRATDVTDRRGAEEVFRGLIEAAPDAMVTVDATGMIELINSRAEEMFGYPREDLIGRQLEVILPYGVRSHIEPWLRLDADSQDAHVALEASGQRRSGRGFPVEVSLSPMTTGAGRHAVAAVRDVSERRRSHQKLRETAAALERSNEDLRKFAYVASHDLAEPLRSIAGFAQLLQRRYVDQVDEVGNEYITRMVGGVERMQLLIGDLLKFSNAGRDELVLGEVDMDEVVQEVLDDLREVIHEKRAEVEVTGLPVVAGDRRQLNLLLENLLANALKFTNGGPPQVEVAAERSATGWTFSVADDGIGIPERHRERIFQAFQRLQARDAYAGTGIGLAVCARIVQRHGGEIRVEEGLGGRGSKFLFTLPDGEEL